MRPYLRAVAAALLIGCLIAGVSFAVTAGVHYLRRNGTALNSLTTSNQALKDDNATLSKVAGALPHFDRELGRLLTEKHANPKQLARLRRQIERLNSRVTPPAPQPTATVTATRTARPAPRVTVTMRPTCRGLKVDGGCIPTSLPSLIR